jgi:DNA-binding response OmpR family regulator
MHFSTNPRVLYIDDYSESSQLIDMLLYIKKCKYDFSVANTPGKALELIAGIAFNLYIIENKLPEMTGIELCRRIRKTDKNTPILFFTRRVRAFDRETALAAGATEYIVKPASLEQITHTIKQLLGEKASGYTTDSKSITNYKINALS